MSDVLNLPNEPKQKLTRAEALAIARAARAKKKETSETGAIPGGYQFAELNFWGQALLTTMQNFQAKSAQGVDACILTADRALEQWKKKREALK